MDQTYAKLYLSLPEGVEQAFELGKSSITLGRAMTNDIVLGDARVSRTHARIECGPQGCTLIDLGSSNGTRLNGKKVLRAGLAPGDTVILGNSSLRYEVDRPQDEPEMTMIDSEADLESTLDHMTLAMSLNETHTPRLVVHTQEKTWEVSLDDIEAISVGRTADNQVVLDHPRVSRHHARVIRLGQGFIVRDLGSTNGVLIKGQRVEEHILQDGDLFRIGDAQLVFKSGFSEEALTMVSETMEKLPARRPVVFIPGFMGSELWQGNVRVWPNVKYLFKHPELYSYPGSAGLEPRGLVGEVVIVPNLIKLEQYNRLGDFLVEDLGYERGKDFFEFAYDWRQDVRRSAQQLMQAVDEWQIKPPLTLIAHSMGTIIGRYYVERLGGKHRVDRLLLMGGPHQGTPKAVTSLVLGPELLPFGIMGERLRRVLSTFPSSYQILPTYFCAVDQNGHKINLLADESWLAEDQQPMLRAAREFRQELGKRSSVPAVSIFGYGAKTIANISVQRGERGKWQKMVYTSEPGGDNTIPERSAVLEGSEIHPVKQYHGTLYVDNDVKMRLKLELTRG